jgi:hypothetical protein
MADRDQGTLFRILPLVPAALILGLVSAAALAGLARAPAAQGCEPRTWRDWHVAVKRECVAPAYVCHNLTSSRLLDDPEVAGAYEDALASNDRQQIQEMDRLVGQLRAAYGCAPSPGRLPAASPHGPGLLLPPGHPSVGGDRPFADPALGLDRSI